MTSIVILSITIYEILFRRFSKEVMHPLNSNLLALYTAGVYVILVVMVTHRFGILTCVL